jgi:hypothetical protein
MKYKLIKEYPGSPNLGTEISSENKNSDWKGIDYYEKYPEYWEKFNEYLCYAVFEKPYMQDDKEYFTPWNIYMIETLDTQSTDRHLFKTREEAQEFILYNKPCLSYKDVMNHKTYLSNQLNEYTLKEFIKSKL